MVYIVCSCVAVRENFVEEEASGTPILDVFVQLCSFQMANNRVDWLCPNHFSCARASYAATDDGLLWLPVLWEIETVRLTSTNRLRHCVRIPTSYRSLVQMFLTAMRGTSSRRSPWLIILN